MKTLSKKLSDVLAISVKPGEAVLVVAFKAKTQAECFRLLKANAELLEAGRVDLGAGAWAEVVEKLLPPPEPPRRAAKRALRKDC